MKRRTVVSVARLAVSVALLLAIAQILDTSEVLARLRDLRAPWVALALGLSLLQVVLLAWRWKYTAARLGLPLSMGRAVSEYYLGIFLNQVLPGGVSGDVSRAWRHARGPAPAGSAVRAVVLERLSSQAVMTAVAIVSLLTLPLMPPTARWATVGGLVLVAAAVLWLFVRRPPDRPRDSLGGRLWADTRTAVLSSRALPLQSATALLAVASYIAIYLVAARSVGVSTPLWALLPLVAPVLMTMLIPVTVAGWGVRESAAAAIWGLVGLTPEDGVAISVSYGLLVLASSVPGAFVLLRVVSGGRDRTGYPRQAESAGTSDGSPHPESRSDRA